MALHECQCLLNKLVSIFMVCIQETFPNIIKLPSRCIVGNFCQSWKLLWSEASLNNQNNNRISGWSDQQLQSPVATFKLSPGLFRVSLFYIHRYTQVSCGVPSMRFAKEIQKEKKGVTFRDHCIQAWKDPLQAGYTQK